MDTLAYTAMYFYSISFLDASVKYIYFKSVALKILTLFFIEPRKG